MTSPFNLLILLLIVLSILLWAWAFYDINKSKIQPLHIKMLWMLIILVAPVIGSIIYFQIRHKTSSAF
ncbi:PLDc N-terminal domain-containing protein [Saccharicrinis sp. FJH62]|uniref:PLDc N-terminal domain-containing protein n=1 Tax=Saccharicrinis sp. FJH62 TaxID=3344657 RepID=UPI0035D4FCAF